VKHESSGSSSIINKRSSNLGVGHNDVDLGVVDISHITNESAAGGKIKIQNLVQQQQQQQLTTS